MRLFWWGVELYARYDRWKYRHRGALHRLIHDGGMIQTDETMERVRDQMNFSEIPSTEALLELHKGHDYAFKIGQRLYSPIGNVHEIVGFEHQFNKNGNVIWGYSVKNEENGNVLFWGEGSLVRKFKPLVERPPRRRNVQL